MENENIQYPKEIEEFHQQLLRLSGVYDVVSGINSLQNVTEKDLSSTNFQHLPQGTLRRTTGGLQREALIQFEFRLKPEADSWKSLEFLAWFVRDQARAGDQIQMRPGGNVPISAGKIQLGQTLYFQIDLFVQNAPREITPILAKIKALAGSLRQALDKYQGAW